MAFDAAMLRFVVDEINRKLAGGKVDKIFQPGKEEAVFVIRCGGEEHRLDISAGGNGSHLNLTAIRTENPTTPPMFCMMLRKHFSGARFAGAEQLGFERAARLTFDTHDEMGFSTRKHVIAELMGRFSNIIITDARDKIIGVLKSVDFTTSEKRQVLAGMTYELPPKQDKEDPTSDRVDERMFKALAAAEDPDRPAEKFIMSHFAGLAPLIAREIVYRAAGRTDATMREAERDLTAQFFRMIRIIRDLDGTPTLLKKDGLPSEYAFTEIRQYGGGCECETCETFGALIDAYYGERSREERLHRKASDVFRLLSNAETRILKKMDRQRAELSDCDDGEKYKLWGDLITANIWKLERGMASCELENWYDEAGGTVKIPLDKRLSPSANAQAYYKKYNKSKTARVHLTEQLAAAEEELAYVYTVLDSLTRAEGERELSEIRAELWHSGYASKMKNYTEKKQSAPSIARYKTSDGHTVLCGRNNVANDYLTTKVAARGDWWFHAKNQPGSHVVLQCFEGERDPSGEAFTEAAEIAAYNSKARGGVMIPVDYIQAGKVKKPAGAKPGFVVYTTNWTAYVTPDGEKISAMKQKG
ncbi:MAG: fibronectin/fibrinogen-binding protein [Ruminococcaceae bacterium]|jgi:predicted ribosome quality control (RQC) complex YloA/Tae2 family protein|nr:fibronectin/fibrinogen-binding protein [Oscillospiraceae bacterium]